MIKTPTRKRSAPTLPQVLSQVTGPKDPRAQKFDNALSLLVKQIVTNSLETNERLDRLKDVLTRDLKEGENVDDLI